MKKFQTLYILVLLLCAGFNGVYAQQQTTYEKKKAELLVQAWAKFGQEGLRGRTYIFEKTDKDVYKEAEAVEEASFLLGRYTISMQFIKWYANELKKAQKLKTSVDFQREAEKQKLQDQIEFEKAAESNIKEETNDTSEKLNLKGEFVKKVDYEGRLDSIFKNFNLQLLQNPYNTNRKILKYYDKMESRGNREDNFNKSLSKIKSAFEMLNNSIEKDLKSTNPTDYCRIYYAQNPHKKNDADEMYMECRCNYSERVNFDIHFIDGNVYGCNCRDNEYQKNEMLFTSKSEFDSFYDKGDEVLHREIAIRVFKTQASIIEILNFKVINKNGNSVGKAILGDMTGIYIPENTQTDKLTKEYIQKIASYKDKPYYSEIIGFVVETNKGLNKEWGKNGELFDNKVEFYEAYISDKYKQVLKAKKH